MRSHHHDNRHLHVLLAQPLHERGAGRDRHFVIDDADLKRIARVQTLLQTLQSLARAPGDDRTHAGTRETFAEHATMRRVVIDDQRPCSAEEEPADVRLRLRLLAARAEHDGEVKATAILVRVGPDPPFHQSYEPCGNREAELAARLARARAVFEAEVKLAGGRISRSAAARVGDRELKRRSTFVLPDQHRAKAYLAALGPLDRIAEQVEEDLPQAARIANEPARHVRRDFVHELDALPMRLQRKRLRDGLDRFVQIERARFELELAGLDFGEVENIVDDAEQGVAGELERLHIFPLLVREVGIETELAHSDDAVQRCPNLVAHVREELALRAVRAFGRRASGLEDLLGLLVGRDVVRNLENMRRFARLVEDRTLHGSEPEDLARSIGTGMFGNRFFRTGVEHCPIGGFNLLDLRRGQAELTFRLPDQLVGRVIVFFRKCAVHERVASSSISHRDEIWTHVDDLPEKRALLLDLGGLHFDAASKRARPEHRGRDGEGEQRDDRPRMAPAPPRGGV